MWLTGLFIVVVPLILMVALVLTPQPSRFRWAISVLAYGMVIGYMWVSARWDISSMYLRHLYLLMILGAAVVGYRRIRVPEKAPGVFQTVFAILLNGALIVFISGLNWFAIRGYWVPEGTVELSSPLRGGEYAVVHGGASPFINGHFRVRPQNYALDIVELNHLGMRAGMGDGRGDLKSYEIFGAEVFSPCDGVIEVVVDEYADLIPPATDPEHLAGNHLLINCGEFEVLLAHLKHGSIRVQVGDSVTTKTTLGLVGNTGNTSEPHLHIHAERAGEPGVILDGVAVPFTIAGRFLVRGDIISDQ